MSLRSPTNSHRLSQLSGYALIYSRFEASPPMEIPGTPTLPERILERYKEHFHASFSGQFLPHYTLIKNFHELVVDALCDYFAFDRMFPQRPRVWRRELCDSLLFEARSRAEKISLNRGNISQELEDMLGL